MGVFGVSLSLKVGEHQCPSSHIVAEGTKSSFCFIQFLNGLDDAHPHLLG